MKKINYIIVLFVLLMTSSVAFAQSEGASDPAAFTLLNHALEIAGALLMLLATWATHKVSGLLKSKTGVEVDSLLESFATKAVHFAEEKAHQQLSSKKKALKGPEKMEVALGFALALAEQNKLPAKAKEKMANYIEAKLGETRYTKF